MGFNTTKNDQALIMEDKAYDVAVIGAGIVGLGTAYQLQQLYPGINVAVIEKEAQVAAHQTGRNSNVIHSGIYYAPGSLKADNCFRGYRMLLAFCEEHSVPYDICGKIIVATSKEELPQLEKIYERGVAHRMEGIKLLPQAATLEIEPHVNVVQSIRVPQTGIIDYRVLSKKLESLIHQKHGKVLLETKVTKLNREDHKWRIVTNKGDLLTKRVVNCTGLYSDEITRLSQPSFKEQIIPFRGEYYELTPEACQLVRHLIYPVPDPAFPFLGVHFTRMIGGGVEAGPSAVLALRREGYSNTDLHWREFLQMLSYVGFRKLIAKHWKMGLGEMHRSFSKKAFVKSLQKLVPEIQPQHLQPAPSGVRAMAVGLDGKLLDDYLFIDQPGMVHACNTPSPAATSGLSIGMTLAEKVMQEY